MKFIYQKELGSVYRLNNGVLEFAPIIIGDSQMFSDDDFNPVEPDLVGDEVISLEGQEITLGEVFNNLITQLEE